MRRVEERARFKQFKNCLGNCPARVEILADLSDDRGHTAGTQRHQDPMARRQLRRERLRYGVGEPFQCADGPNDDYLRHHGLQRDSHRYSVSRAMRAGLATSFRRWLLTCWWQEIK